jgi:hypothetical protein
MKKYVRPLSAMHVHFSPHPISDVAMEEIVSTRKTLAAAAIQAPALRSHHKGQYHGKKKLSQGVH